MVNDQRENDVTGRVGDGSDWDKVYEDKGIVISTFLFVYIMFEFLYVALLAKWA